MGEGVWGCKKSGFKWDKLADDENVWWEKETIGGAPKMALSFALMELEITQTFFQWYDQTFYGLIFLIQE